MCRRQRCSEPPKRHPGGKTINKIGIQAHKHSICEPAGLVEDPGTLPEERALGGPCSQWPVGTPEDVFPPTDAKGQARCTGTAAKKSETASEAKGHQAAPAQAHIASDHGTPESPELG